jgi:hypothetical protein
MPDNVCLDAKHRSPGFGSCDLEPAVIAGQHPQAAESGNPTQTGELPNTETIDPAILNDHTFPGGEQMQSTETITGIATCPDKCLSECSHPSNQGPPLQSRQ